MTIFAAVMILRKFYLKLHRVQRNAVISLWSLSLVTDTWIRGDEAVVKRRFAMAVGLIYDVVPPPPLALLSFQKYLFASLPSQICRNANLPCMAA